MTTTPGIRLAGRQAIHGVGRELGPPVANPARPDDPAERGEQVGLIMTRRACRERVPPLPLVWARRCTSSACSTARGEDREQQQQRLDPPRGGALGQEPLLDSGVARRCRRRRERRDAAASSGRSGSSGSTSFSSRTRRAVTREELSQQLASPRPAASCRARRRRSEPCATRYGAGLVEQRPPRRSGRRRARRCSTGRRAAPGSPALRRCSRPCPGRAPRARAPAGVIPKRRSPARQSASMRR